MAQKKKKVRRAPPVDPGLPGALGRMTAEELDRYVARFDREFVKTRPLTAADRAWFKRAQRAWRTRENKARYSAERVRRVVITLNDALLRRADEAAKRRGLTRSALFAQTLEAALRRTG
ncbi:MAG TPA: hypothetical protein VGM03_05945 [Phycisphaerae bacterium]|jgi:hypothetical protein